MREKPPLSKIIAAVSAVIVFLIVFILLIIWTLRIYEDRRREDLQGEIDKVTAEGGEAALLALGGYEIDNIFYSDDGLILFEEGDKDWLYSADELQNISVYRQCAPSVVEIYTENNLSGATGCGVIISSDGYIVTNTHVVNARGSLSVKFHDGSVEDASVVGTDPVTDIAVIRVDDSTRTLMPLAFRSADELVVGQKVIAIGSPYGYSWSQSVGMISALERTVTSSQGVSLSMLIQTDAQINPGNSGGPLLDGKGNMIGLITAIYSTSGSAQGVSFAIPVNTVIEVASEIIRLGHVDRGTLDILCVELNPMIVDYASLPVSEGILISQVIPAGEADSAGLRGGIRAVQYGNSVIYLGGDVITALDDTPVRGYSDYYAFMAASDSGDKVDVSVNRNGDEIVIKNVPLVEQTLENMRWVIR